MVAQCLGTLPRNEKVLNVRSLGTAANFFLHHSEGCLNRSAKPKAASVAQSREEKVI